jgi:hypothetical protein
MGDHISFHGFRGTEVWKPYFLVQEVVPLIQCIANFVRMDIIANMLLAAGAAGALPSGAHNPRNHRIHCSLQHAAGHLASCRMLKFTQQPTL